MGHYDDCYEAEYKRIAKLKADRIAAAKKQFPDEPSKWGLSNEERLKMLEDRLNKLENKCR